MMLEFSVANFLSFKDKRTFTMEATSIKDEPLGNVVKEGGHNLLRTAAVYGANSSGKSNLISAFAAMGLMIIESVKLNDRDSLKYYSPFLLSSETENKPTHFEILFLSGTRRVRYGFEYNFTEIVEEWLFVKDGKRKETPLFTRDKEGIWVDQKCFKEGAGKEESTNGNRLFLSLVAQLGGTLSKEIIRWFWDGYAPVSGLMSKGFLDYTKSLLLKQEKACDEVLALLEKLQLGFSTISAKEREAEQAIASKSIKSDSLVQKTITLYTSHNKYDEKGKNIGEVIFDFEQSESSGTQKILDLIGIIYDTLQNGRTLIIDELDAKMHVLLSIEIIKLFNDPETNKNNAQLIFTTHDTHLLSSNLLRRDQIWFTEKDQVESTDLYRLMDIQFADGSKPRNDSNYEKNYINGRYGAIPYIK